ncbi:MAG: BamA/TamA family outer membrane protein, partial [Muribaculaceae bacterium]|nr:BamA/TamA family outer membrane protein [Muribaculaceae bacterium]
VMSDTAALSLRPGALFDRNVLDNDRTAITEALRNAGYYAFNKDNITFIADTTAGSKAVELTMNIYPPKKAASTSTFVDDERPSHHYIYKLRKIIFVTDPNLAETNSHNDTVDYRSIIVVYGHDHYIKPGILEEKCYLRPGATYRATNVDRTYEALGQLGILKFINIEMKPVTEIDDEIWMDAVITISRNRKQGISIEVEGTNSEGDLGFGAGVTYQHRNLAKNSELLTAKLRGAYESLSGNFDGLINDRYTEIAGEVGITFPKFEFPFLSKSFKQRQRASTEFALSFVHQERPEYTRIIAGAAWRYKWSRRERDILRRHNYDLIDVNYVRLPRSTIDFIDQIAPANPLLRYSYEDHFIMRTGYTYSRTNRRIPTASVNAFAIQPSVTTLRASGELAGNILYAISSLDGAHRHDGAYKIFGIQFAQYVKGEIDYTYTRNLNSRNALAWHASFGIAYPYGNSSMVPFEKRFYAGGANSVRGWGVRTLGPGAYDSKNSVSDFINQCGDISLDLSVEYRAKLFWVLEGAAFIDAGNIWTIRKYENQPEGEFRFNKFYRQIAAAYG